MKNSQIVARIEDVSARHMVTRNVADMLGDDVAVGHEDEAIGVGLDADRPISERGWNTVAILVERHQPGRGNSLSVLHKSFEV